MPRGAAQPEELGGNAVGQPLATQPSPHRSHAAMPGWAALGHAVETQLGVGGPPSPHRDGEQEAMGLRCALRSPVLPSRPRTSTCARRAPVRTLRRPQPVVPPRDSTVRHCDITATLRAPCPAFCVCLRACHVRPNPHKRPRGGGRRRNVLAAERSFRAPCSRRSPLTKERPLRTAGAAR